MQTQHLDEEREDEAFDLLSGQTADITEVEKVEFLQLVRQGLNRKEAARVLGYHARPWRALTSPSSPFYDEDFTHAYGEAVRSPEYQVAYSERLRERINELAMQGEVRLLEKLGMVHLPEWSVLRQKDINVNVTALIQQRLKMLPTDLIERVLDHLERGEEIEEADFKELTAAGDDQESV